MLIRHKISVSLLCALGVTVGILCAFVGLVVAGAGHGWCSAFPFGFLSLALSPIAFYRLAKARSASKKTSFKILVLAAILDMLLIWSTLSEGFNYFNKVLDFAIIWLALWMSWQLAALATYMAAKPINHN